MSIPWGAADTNEGPSLIRNMCQALLRKMIAIML